MSGEQNRQKEPDRPEAHVSNSTVSGECPDCGGAVITKDNRKICTECDVVLNDSPIDPGPPWRAYNQEEEESVRHVGPSHSVGEYRFLGTKIGANSANVPAEKRRRLLRIRKQNRRSKRDGKEKSIRAGLVHIDRTTTALGLPEDVEQLAGVIYRRAVDEDLMSGRSIEAMADASVYNAARHTGYPRTFETLEKVSQVKIDRITSAFRYLLRELELALDLTSPQDYLPQIISELNISGEAAMTLEAQAKELLHDAKEQGLHSGRAPSGLAGGAIYTAGKRTGMDVTQDEVAEPVGISTVTVRSRYEEFREL